MSQTIAIRSALRSANALQRAIFAIACAERTAVVFRRFAASVSVAVYDTVLDSAWDAIKKRKSIPVERRESLASVPEAEIEDSDLKEHYATLAMGVLEHAIDALNASDAWQAADLACCQSLDLYACFDAIALGSPNMIVDPANPPLPGPLEQAEIIEQSETLRFLTEAAESDVAGTDRLRDRANSASQILDSAIATLVNVPYKNSVQRKLSE